MGTNTESNAFPFENRQWDELLKAIRPELLNGWESSKIRASYVNPIFGWDFPIYWFDPWAPAQCENFNNASQNDGFKPDESEVDKLIEEFE